VERGLKRIRLLLMDVDGVLTDGLIYHVVEKGGRLIELKGMDTQDGISLVWLAEAGIRTGIISGRTSDGVRARARMLRMSHIVQGRLEKLPEFERILRKARLRPEQAAFIGDDLTDVPVLRAAGWGVAPASARPEAKAAADYVTRSPGGRGAVREVAELLLKAHGLWNGMLKRYGA
jgi:3-deoxy-D-manno-octulosonate 8-phosphate phosphatase (KDO 8-P phosphatase)